MKRLFLTCIASLAAVAAFAGEADVKAITAGVGKPEKPQWCGILNVWGETAFPVLTVKSDWEVHFASVAAATYGKGRVVALGYPVAKDAPNVMRLFANAVAWAGNGRRSPQIACVGGGDPFPAGAKNLTGKGWGTKLGGVDVVVVTGHAVGDAKDIRGLQGFVKNGGGLVVEVLGYQYIWDHPGASAVTDYQPNQLLIPMGLAYVDNNGYEPDANGPEELKAAYAPAQLDRLIEFSNAKGELNKAAVQQANGIVTDSCRFAPAGTAFAKALKKATDGLGQILITPQQPLTWKEPLKRLAVVVKANEARTLPADKIKADPCGDVFPGKVAANAPRVKREITFEVDYSHWASTGLYVPAGEVATVKIPKELAGKGVVAQIGCHNSPIVITESWSRHPMLVMSWPLKGEVTKIASPYGGLLYFVVPEGVRLPRQTVTIDHVVQAPRYVRGETPLYEWQTLIRNYPGPTAEIGSSRITLTIPSDIARKVENPEELMQLWDRIMDLYVDLGMRPLRIGGERVVSDEQIAYGYMYAGYPIMTFLDAADFGTDAKFLTTKGSWGHWHELGHNQQVEDWTFEGCGEVTENWFSLIVMEKVAGQSVKDWLAKEMPKAKEHFAAGAPFEKWKSEPFLALTMYAQLQQAFGWESFYKVIAVYRDLPDRERPKTDDEKRDQWMVRFSRVIGKNLGPFFVKWGVPTSQKARDSIKDLPTWMPEGM